MKVMIGLETHVQLNTKTKLFCSCPTYGDDTPNTRVCEICLGFPGSKPFLNEAVVDKALRVAVALNCKINKKLTWDRKSYFYPDMAKNFQITQYDTPLAHDGFIMVGDKKIRIRRLHIEEDPAKLVHVGGNISTSDYVLVDYNRSGIPLIEIVTEPDFESPEEAREYLSILINILEHIDVFESGKYTIKTDANISLDGGARVEIKNISGVKAVEQALRFEIVRQKNLLKRGRKVERETRHFNPASNTTIPLRTKEEEMDYGYIVDTDLPPLVISNDKIKHIKQTLPELPLQRIERFVKEYKLNKVIAESLVSDKALADFYEECLKNYKDSQRLASWVSTHLLKCLNYNKQTIRTSKITPQLFLKFMSLMDTGKITERYGKELIKEFVVKAVDPSKLVKSSITTGEALKKLVLKVMSQNKDIVSQIKSGNQKLINFLIGKVLKKCQADPKEIIKLIKENL